MLLAAVHIAGMEASTAARRASNGMLREEQLAVQYGGRWLDQVSMAHL